MCDLSAWRTINKGEKKVTNAVRIFERRDEKKKRLREVLITRTSTTRAMDTNRLAKELREIQADTKSGVTVTVIGDDLGHMQGTILGEWAPRTMPQKNKQAKEHSCQIGVSPSRR